MTLSNSLLPFIVSLIHINASLSLAGSELLDGARTLLDNAKSNPSIENLTKLGRQIDALARYKGKDANAQALRDDLIEGMISIPGYAQRFADEIERERATVENLPPNVGKRVSYDTHRAFYFDVLAHLPGPETVEVIGNCLDDDRDLALVPPHKPGAIDVTGGSPANAALAATTLTQMGIRNPPIGKSEYISDFREPASRWKAWYEEVKTGKRRFSFVGTKVEYRFKPDGTWDTLAMANPPGDAPKPPQARDRAKEQPTTRPVPPVRTVWPWIIGGTLGVLVAAVWLRLRFWKPKP